MNLLKREWGAITFVVTVVIGAIAVAISLIVAGAHAPPTPPLASCPSYTPYVSTPTPTPSSSGTTSATSTTTSSAPTPSATPFNPALANCPTPPLPPTSTPAPTPSGSTSTSASATATAATPTSKATPVP